MPDNQTHDARVTELLNYNNEELERRRAATILLRRLRDSFAQTSVGLWFIDGDAEPLVCDVANLLDRQTHQVFDLAAAIAELTTGGSDLTFLPEDTNAETKAELTGVEACGLWTDWEGLRFLGYTHEHAVLKALAAYRKASFAWGST